MVVADLHVHTTNSDGELALADVPDAAQAGGVDVVAVTDHDRTNPELSAPVTDVDGVTVLHGIELRVDADAERLDLLGYGLAPTTALERECERLQRDRVERAARMLDRVEAETGVRPELELSPGVGRPHVARAIVEHPDLDYDVGSAFEELLGEGRPCYVARSVPSFDRGRRLLEESCRLVGLAHPLRYDDPATALERLAELDAVERHYPYDRPVDPTDPSGGGLVERAVEAHGVVATGGSDAHGRTLGIDGLDADAFEPVRAALGLPPSVAE